MPSPQLSNGAFGHFHRTLSGGRGSTCEGVTRAGSWRQTTSPPAICNTKRPNRRPSHGGVVFANLQRLHEPRGCLVSFAKLQRLSEPRGRLVSFVKLQRLSEPRGRLVSFAKLQRLSEPRGRLVSFAK